MTYKVNFNLASEVNIFFPFLERNNEQNILTKREKYSPITAKTRLLIVKGEK